MLLALFAELVRLVQIDNVQILAVVHQYAKIVAQGIVVHIGKHGGAFRLYHRHIGLTGLDGGKNGVKILFALNVGRIDLVFIQKILTHNDAILIEQRAVDGNLIAHASHRAGVQVISQTRLNVGAVGIQQLVQIDKAAARHIAGYISSKNKAQIDLLAARHNQIELIFIGTVWHHLHLQIQP